MKKGFTLVELLATITILGIIALLLVPTVIGTMNRFREGFKRKSREEYYFCC